MRRRMIWPGGTFFAPEQLVDDRGRNIIWGWVLERKTENVKYQAKIEIGIKNFLDKYNYKAFTTNFEDLHGLDQLPGLASQRLMEQQQTE